MRPHRAMLALVVCVGTVAVVPVTASAQSTPAYFAQWGSEGSALDQFGGNAAIAAAPNGDTYVADTANDRVEEFDPSGNLITAWGSLGSEPGEFDAPRGIVVGPSGDVYVADADNNRIEEFDGSGDFLTQWGSAGSGQGQFYPSNNSFSVATDAAGDVYVADAGNDRVEEFDPQGTFLREYDQVGPNIEGAENYPTALAIDATGNLYVMTEFGNESDDGNVVVKLSSSGQLLETWAINRAWVQAQYADTMAVSSAGVVYIPVDSNSVVGEFDENGNLIGSFGTQGTGLGQFGGVTGLALDAESDLFVYDSYHVEKYGLDGPPTNTVPPGEKGTLQDGKTLTATSVGTWQDPSALSYSYQWQRCPQTSGTICEYIEGATNATYKLTYHDVGFYVRVLVTATDQAGRFASANSAPAGPVAAPLPPRNTKLPVITGRIQSGQNLTTTNGSWSSPDGLGYFYQWQRCSGSASCSNIPNATQRTYLLTSADIGDTITVVVTAEDAEGQTSTATAAQTAAVT